MNLNSELLSLDRTSLTLTFEHVTVKIPKVFLTMCGLAVTMTFDL